MMKIDDRQKEKIYEVINKMTSDIDRIIKEIDNIQNDLKQFCDYEDLQTYYIWSIDERLNEAKIRLNMTQIRIEEFRSEADCLELSTSGFY